MIDAVGMAADEALRPCAERGEISSGFGKHPHRSKFLGS